MTDLENAQALLKRPNVTCVLCQGESVIMSTKSGISPMLDLLIEHEDVKGFSAADKIVGKAAAMLFDLAGIKIAYGDVVSEAAMAYATKHGMELTYGTLVQNIVNRKGDGPCPMEQTVATIQDAKEAFRALKQKRAELQAGRC